MVLLKFLQQLTPRKVRDDSHRSTQVVRRVVPRSPYPASLDVKGGTILLAPEIYTPNLGGTLYEMTGSKVDERVPEGRVGSQFEGRGVEWRYFGFASWILPVFHGPGLEIVTGCEDRYGI